MKTWQELGLPSQKHMDALVLVRDRLRDGTLEQGDGSVWPERGRKQFDMTVWCNPPPEEAGEHCGTVACIGGWSEVIGGVRWPDSGSVDELFLPGVPNSWRSITPAQAADAIDRFLDGQEPW